MYLIKILGKHIKITLISFAVLALHVKLISGFRLNVTLSDLAPDIWSILANRTTGNGFTMVVSCKYIEFVLSLVCGTIAMDSCSNNQQN